MAGRKIQTLFPRNTLPLRDENPVIAGGDTSATGTDEIKRRDNIAGLPVAIGLTACSPLDSSEVERRDRLCLPHVHRNSGAWPAGEGDGWRLTVRVEDVVGPHTPEEESVPDSPEEIALDDFGADFIAPDRGTAYVSVITETSEAKHRFGQIFADLVRGRHAE